MLEKIIRKMDIKNVYNKIDERNENFNDLSVCINRTLVTFR